MLKISFERNSASATLVLEGKVVGPWAEELGEVWRDLCPPRDWVSLQVDIREVTFLDRQGLRVLREIIEATHAEFITNSPLTRHFANQAKDSTKVYALEDC